MTDNRIQTLAKNLIGYSCRLQEGEKVLIEASKDTVELVRALVREAYAVGGMPIVRLSDASVTREVLMGVNEDLLKTMSLVDETLMREVKAYIGVRGGENSTELSDVPGDNINLYDRLYSHGVHHEIRVKHTKWVSVAIHGAAGKQEHRGL